MYTNVISNGAGMPSFASLCGKLVWGGWPVDRFGARKTYVGSMIALALCVLCYTWRALISSWHAVAVLAFCVEFSGCTTYPVRKPPLLRHLF